MLSERLTCCIGELLLFPLDPVLERLSLATRLLDAGLHRLRRNVARPAWIHIGRIKAPQRDRIGWELADEKPVSSATAMIEMGTLRRSLEEVWVVEMLCGRKRAPGVRAPTSKTAGLVRTGAAVK